MAQVAIEPMWLSITDASERLNKSRRQIIHQVHQGNIPAVMENNPYGGGSRYLVDWQQAQKLGWYSALEFSRYAYISHRYAIRLIQAKVPHERFGNLIKISPDVFEEYVALYLEGELYINRRLNYGVK